MENSECYDSQDISELVCPKQTIDIYAGASEIAKTSVASIDSKVEEFRSIISPDEHDFFLYSVLIDEEIDKFKQYYGEPTEPYQSTLDMLIKKAKEAIETIELYPRRR